MQIFQTAGKAGDYAMLCSPSPVPPNTCSPPTNAARQPNQVLPIFLIQTHGAGSEGMVFIFARSDPSPWPHRRRFSSKTLKKR